MLGVDVIMLDSRMPYQIERAIFVVWSDHDKEIYECVSVQCRPYIFLIRPSREILPLYFPLDELKPDTALPEVKDEIKRDIKDEAKDEKTSGE